MHVHELSCFLSCNLHVGSRWVDTRGLLWTCDITTIPASLESVGAGSVAHWAVVLASHMHPVQALDVLPIQLPANTAGKTAGDGPALSPAPAWETWETLLPHSFGPTQLQ